MGSKTGLSKGKGRAKKGSKIRHKRWLNKKR